MSRHRHRKQNQYYDDRDGEGERPLPPRKSGNQSLYIALGAAGAIGLIVLLIITGSSSSEEDTTEALVTLQTFFRTCLEDRADEGSKMLVAREILRDQNTNDTKVWASLPPERRAELEQQAFRWIRGIIIQELQLTSMDDVNSLLRASEAVPFGGDNRVDFQWKVGADSWNAKMIHIGDKWYVERFDRTNG
jgi:hypothetical protein